MLLAVGVGCWWVRADQVEPAALICCCCCFGRIVPLMMGSGIICRWAATSRCDPVCDLHWDWNWLQIRAEPGNICQINQMQIRDEDCRAAADSWGRCVCRWRLQFTDTICKPKLQCAVHGMISELMRMLGQSDARFITVLVNANSASTSCSSCDGHRRALIKDPVMEHSKDGRSCWFGEQGRRKRFIVILIKVCFSTFESFGFLTDDMLAVSWWCSPP